MMQTDKRASTGAYRWYVLGLFTLVYAFNFIDRQIITILAPYLKVDLGITDAQVGLLFGTAFALFYALFGIPLAKLADGWHRVRTLSIGLAFWSAMTTVSGLATNFTQLALARVGVGVGEASASPAATSILLDYFPKAKRATALAIYMSGIYVGAGASLMIGGQIVGWWEAAYPIDPPFGMAGWQAAYFAVGIPGLILALLVVTTVREPVRGAIDGRPHAGDPAPFRATFREMATMFPPFSLFSLKRLGGTGSQIAVNAMALIACAAGAALVIALTNQLLAPAKRAVISQIGALTITTNFVQWTAIAIGVYATWSWIQSVRLRDPVAARLILSTPSFYCPVIAGGLVSYSSYGFSTFIFLHGKTYLGLESADGWYLGAIAALAGGIGTTIGGVIGDWARQQHPSGRLYVAIGAAAISAAFSLLQYSTASVTTFYVANFFAILFLTLWLGPVSATLQDQVLPRMRGLAMAVQFLGANLIGLGLGPYVVGLVSDATGDLRFAMLTALVPAPAAVILFLIAARHLPAAEATLDARARAEGERLD
ncbi:spinster family MFS transporter [Sphingomonas sp. KC8]|uniref:spinster family MFS transporter n=1 Tax=Sphingomonas sp. KC8 TaxID=1030157 RepID=UPI00024893F4|nr:MFS transporter [Sphingomonas sp. KC8]ARS29322.1 MFS transporter [Sphingomonas sp. KC8]